MKAKKTFKVGDKIVDFGQVCLIFKTKKRKNPEGKEEKVIFFRPYFKNDRNRTLLCSIPLKNIKKTKIRRPISKKQLAKLLKSLSQKTKDKKPINLPRLKEILSLNEAQKTAEVLRTLWAIKMDETTTFTKSRKDIFTKAMRRLVEEVAFVGSLPPEKAKEKIKKALEKGKK